MNASGRLLFLHIPKTAGTSLNALLQSHCPPGAAALHIEHEALGRPWQPADFADKQMVAGHLKFSHWQKLFDIKQHVFVTVLRDPARQFLSQLAWLIRFSREESRAELEKLHPVFQAMIGRLASAGPVSFIESISGRELAVFDNQQARQFVSVADDQPLEDCHYAEACERLAALDLIGLTEHLQEFVLMLAWRMRWSRNISIPRLNQADQQYYQPMQASYPALSQLIQKRTAIDQRLYRHALVLFERQRQHLADALRPGTWMQRGILRRHLARITEKPGQSRDQAEAGV